MSILEDLMAVMGLNDEKSSLGGIGGSAILMVPAAAAGLQLIVEMECSGMV